MTTRTVPEIENDLVTVDQALATVSEIRSSLHQFTRLIQTERKTPNFVYQFSDRLNTIKRELNRLSTAGENLKVPLEYSQHLVATNGVDLNLISNFQKELTESSFVAEDEQKPKDTGAVVKEKAQYLLRELAPIVLQPRSQSPTLSSSTSDSTFFSTYIKQWLAQEKPSDVNIDIQIHNERGTITGSTCTAKVTIMKALTAVLDLEYNRAADGLVLHYYAILGPKEEKPCGQDSQYLVFQKIGLIAKDAFEDMVTTSATESLSSIFHWLCSYHNLFVEPCCRCHKRLQYDSPQYKYLPPMVRTWVQRRVNPAFLDRETPSAYTTVGMPYHMRCFIETTNVK